MKPNISYDDLKFTGLAVYKKEGEEAEQLIKRFKKMVARDGILYEYRQRQFYESKSVRRKREEAECARRIKQKMNKYKKEY